MNHPRFEKALRAMPALPAILVALVLAACAQPPVRNEPSSPAGNPAIAEARSQERNGARAFARNDYESAQSHYRRAAQIYQSLALADPLAQAQLSQARVLAQAGQLSLARQQVAAVLDSRAVLSPAILTAAHGRAASLSLQGTAAELATAEQHLLEAEKLCAARCPETSALSVLRGRLHLARAEPQAALQAALQARQTAGTPADQANALRLSAQSHQLLGAPAEARTHAEQALALDQASGAADRVALDLTLIAQAYQAQGDTASAHRAQALAEQSSAAVRALRDRVSVP